MKVVSGNGGLAVRVPGQSDIDSESASVSSQIKQYEEPE